MSAVRNLIALIGAEFNRRRAARGRLEAERHEALARAAAHERHLGVVIETMVELFSIIDRDGRYVLVNRAMEEAVGVPRDRILGARIGAVPWGRRAADGAPFRVEDHPFERLRRGEPSVRDCELQLVPPQGRPRTISVNAVPLRDAAGNFDGAVVTSVDITDRDRKSTRLNSSHVRLSRMPSSA